MRESLVILSEYISFKDFVLASKRHKLTLIVAALAMTVQFTLFKFFYPFASFIHADSFVYLRTAYLNLDINSYLVGYGRFLRIFSVFSKSDTVLVAFQYLILQASALYLLYTLFYFYKTTKTVQTILIIFIVCNPLFLFLANYVSTDALFLALSLSWITTLIWLIYKPNILLILCHTVMIFICFTVRYNALIYPFIATVAFVLMKQPLKIKLLAFIGQILLIGLFVLYTGNKFKELTGTWQYSPFSGWQIINNAMYAYRYADSKDRIAVPVYFHKLDNAIREYFDSTRDLAKHPEEKLIASTVYMWDPNHSPLYKFRDKLYAKHHMMTELQKWSSIAPLYARYGTFLIKKYPRLYIKHFLWPNSIKYFSPPVEVLESYNMGLDTVANIAKIWFGYKNQKVTTRFKDFNVRILNFYPILSGIMNVSFFLGVVCFFLLNGHRRLFLFTKGLCLVGSFWMANAGFTIFASSPALRFQSFPIILICIFTILLAEFLCKSAMDNSKEDKSNINVLIPQ